MDVLTNFKSLDDYFKQNIKMIVNISYTDALAKCEDAVYKEQKKITLLEMKTICDEFRTKHAKTWKERMMFRLRTLRHKIN